MTPAGSFPSLSSGSEAIKRIAIFAATSWERKAVESAFPSGLERRIGGSSVFVHAIGRREYWLTQTGVGSEKAGRCAAQLLASRPFCLTISTGFACALIAADIGALLVSREVMHRGESCDAPSVVLDVPGHERDRAVMFARTLVPPERIGRFISTDRIIGRASEKRQVAKQTQAIGLDMESSALAVEAQRARVPFVIVRSVSDLLDEDLPLDFNLFLRPTGWLKGMGTVLAAPSCLLGFGRLHRQSKAAGEALTDFFRRYVSAMATERHEQELTAN